MSRILVIDDDDQLRKSFAKLLVEEQYTVFTAASGEEGLEQVQENTLDLVLLDMRLPGMNGMEVFKRIKTLDSKLPVIIITAYSTTEIAIEATKAGAYDYIIKPFDIPEMLTLIRQAIDAGYCMRSPVQMDAQAGDATGDAIVGQSRRMQEVYKNIGRVAQTDATVLIRGESGTGKELVARAVYQHSNRADNPFLIINCVAIPEHLLESELFGYEKGAFTGATQRHIGKIEQAHKGTIFLDEIGDMPLNIQAKILRLLQERCIERLGGEETITVDVRIVAATNKPLEQAIADGTFREDLYFRLKVVTIELPPLRERQGDVAGLVTHYMDRFARELKVVNPGIQPRALALLERYEWPGNVRELSNMIQKVLIFNRGAPVSMGDVEQLIHRKRADESGERIDPNLLKNWVWQQLTDPSASHRFEDFMDTLSEIVISQALKYTNGNRSQAARMLEISRPTLHARMDKYDITFKIDVA